MSERGVRALESLNAEIRKLRQTSEQLGRNLDRQAPAPFALASTIRKWFGDRTQQPALGFDKAADVPKHIDGVKAADPASFGDSDEWTGCYDCDWRGPLGQYPEHFNAEHAS